MMIWVNLFIVTLLKILIFWFWYIAWYKLKLFGNLGSWNKKFNQLCLKIWSIKCALFCLHAK